MPEAQAAQLDLTLGIRHLNSYGRLLSFVGFVVHAGIMYACPMILPLLGVSYALVTYSIYYFAYKNSFCRTMRYERQDAKCPSNSYRPEVEEVPMDERRRASQLFERRSLKVTKGYQGILDMDHVDMSWAQFLSAWFMIVPSALLLQIIGLTKMVVRKWSNRHGLVQPRPVEYDVEVAQLCLESMQAIRFTGFKDATQTIAIFTWSEFPYVVDEEVKNGHEEVDYAELFVVEIDLSNGRKRLVKAMLDDRELTAQEAYILINFNTIAHAHPKIHALANMGVHVGNAHPFIRWNSVVTVMYNYFSMSVFTQIASLYQAIGLLSYDYNVITTFFELGCEDGIQRDNIRKLVPHSNLVKFLVGVRNIFLNEFQNYRGEFVGIDVEALFAGTVLHSLEHTMYTTHLKDVLWLDHNHSEFGFMAECAQMVLESFSKDVPLLPFNRRFRNASHPFYKAVYEGARSLDPWFADRMDACIVK